MSKTTNINPFAILAKNGFNDLTKIGNAIFNQKNVSDVAGIQADNNDSTPFTDDFTQKTVELLKNQEQLLFTITNLVEKTNDKDQEIQNLRKELSEYIHKFEELKNIYSMLESRNSKLETTNEQLAKEINDKNKEAETLTKIESILSKKASEEIQEIQNLRKDLSDVGASFETLHSVSDKLVARLGALDALNESLKNGVVTEKIFAGISQKIESIEKETVEILKSLSSLKEDQLGFFEKRDSENYELASKALAVQTLENIIEKQGDAILQLTDKVRVQESYEDDSSSLRIELDAERAAAQSLREQIAGLESRNANLQKEALRNQSLLTEKTWTEADIHTLKQRISELERELANSRRSDEDNPELKRLIEASLRDAEMRVRDAVKEKEKIEKSFKERFIEQERELNEKSEVLKEIEKEKAEIRESLKTMTEYCSNYKKDYEVLEDKLEDMRDESEKRITEIIEEYEESQNQIEDLRSEILELRKREADLSKWGPLLLFKEKVRRR